MIGFLVAGAASGVGKTTTALCCMAALRERGLRVQPFKCGPDFLDAGHHGALCGRPSRNLDTWLMTPETNRGIFAQGCREAEAAVVEGVMGLFDGVDGASEAGSSAEIAKLLDLPVVLVVDASHCARSIAAVAHGFTSFDPALRFAGLVLNGVAGPGHERILREALATATQIPVLGALPRDPDVAIPERHLGLHTAEESATETHRLAAYARLARAHMDLEPLLQAVCAPLSPLAPVRPAPQPSLRVGVARDRAFCFYYEDNFDLLRELGAELEFFSPLTDTRLPGSFDALYLGGGYPELYAHELTRNEAMRQAVREFASSGRPLYAECGGMLYLGGALHLASGEAPPMCAVLPADFAMTGKLQRFGYVEAALEGDCILGPAGARVRGHSFHYSCALPGADSTRNAYQSTYRLGGQQAREGYRTENILASYIHLCFRSNPEFARAFLRSASKGAR